MLSVGAIRFEDRFCASMQACQAGLSSEIKTRFIRDFRKEKIRREEKREERRKRGREKEREEERKRGIGND